MLGVMEGRLRYPVVLGDDMYDSLGVKYVSGNGKGDLGDRAYQAYFSC